jgi:glucose-6-phosphate dehydrogenase assembly protein OpcA
VTDAEVDSWSGEDVSVGEIERRLAALRQPRAADGLPNLRTSVMTHIAWVPKDWEKVVRAVIAGLADRHPSRAILLLPDPDAADGIDARASLQCFAVPGSEHHVCAELIELRLRGERTKAPASIVAPLLVADLPVFARWRGQPPFDGAAFEGLVDLVDRLIVDSAEWRDVPGPYADLARFFPRTACSDIAWRRTEPWRRSLAALWPAISEVRELHVRGPRAEAVLLAGWLRSRLEREVELAHEEADELEVVEADVADVEPPAGDRPSPSDLLSEELDVLSRDRIYEAAARAANEVALTTA